MNYTSVTITIIGINENFNELKKYNYETRLQQNIPMRNDGSVGYSV